MTVSLSQPEGRSKSILPVKKTIYLVDGTSLVYRAFYALKLSSSKGVPTGAVYGFYNILNKVVNRYKPVYLGICFDVSRKTFRQEKFAQYKINRPPAPDDLKAQVPLIKQLLAKLGLAFIEKEGYEADDLIASLTRKALKDGFNVTIIASDKDMFQLLTSDEVTIYNPHKDKLLTRESFEKEFGFPAPLIADYLGLCGDSVDNIPGAEGIGESGAAKLVKEFGTIENIFANLDKISPRVREALEKSRDNVLLSKELAELNSDDHLGVAWDSLQPGEPDTNGLYELFSELEFKSLLKKIPAPSLQVKIQVQDGLPQDFKEKCKADGLVFYTQSQIAYVFNDKVTYKAPLKDIQDLLNDGSVRKISFDFKAQMLYENLELNNMWFDVKIAAYLVDPSLADYEFAAVVSRYLAQRTDQIPAEGYPYFIKQLYDGFIFALEEGGLAKLFFDVEMPLVNVLYGMEKNGIHIDGAIMAKLLSDIDDELNHTQAKVYQIAGKEFNLNSPKQLQDILFNVMKIKPVRKTKTGYSTDEEVLKVLSKEQIIAAELLKYREANKLKTTYLVPLIEMIKSDGMLHAQFNQTAAATGRLSSSSPNLQSIPAKGRFSAGLRKAFIPSFDNGFIVAADYSQIELRILAHFSQDEKLAQAFRENIDIHAFTASLLFGLAQKDIGEEQRDLAKKINFAVLYGMGAYSLSQELEISVGQAETFIQDYFLRYPKVKEYIDNVLTEAERNGYVRTILGRKRNLLDLGSKQIQMREFARRQAVNTPIQGSCADLIKLAMVNIDREFSDKKLRSKLIIQIHDELVFDVTADEKDKVVEIIKRRMETALTLSVPLKVNVLLGNNWGEMVAVN